jgi:Bacterial protein of unknown function (DUF885)
MGHFQQISDLFLQYLKSDVDESVSLGLPDNLARLGDPSLKAREQSLAQAQDLLAQIDDSRGDNFYQTLDLQLVRHHLQRDIFFHTLEINGELQRCQKPGGVDGIGEGIFQLFVNDERPARERLEDILARLQQAPDYLLAELSVLTTPVNRWRDIEIEQAEELPDLFGAILNWADETGFERRDTLREQVACVNASLRDYVAGLRAKPGVDTFAIGLDKVKQLLAIKQIHRSPEQLRQMAADFMAQTRESIEALRCRLVAKYQLAPDTDAEGLQAFLNKKFTVALKDGEVSSVLDVYQSEREKILAFIEQRDLFPVPQDQDMVIMMTPGFLQPVIPAGAMWPPLALREGTRKSMVHLTLKAEEMDEHTHLGIGTMMIHEGIPGHHLQFASASLQPSLVRRIFDASEHAEGWTTMLEDYMLDIGYVEADLVDEVRYITKLDISRLVARVGIDLYFMTGDKHYLDVGLELQFDSTDPFVNAATLLKAATGFTDGRVQAELNWYSTEQGYPLCYLTGNRLVWELKKDVVSANRKNLSEQALDREFHRLYLESGCMPVASLRRVFEHEGFL